MPQPKFQLYKHIKISGKFRDCRAAIYSNGSPIAFSSRAFTHLEVAAREVPLRRGRRRAHGRRRESLRQPKISVSAETTATESRID